MGRMERRLDAERECVKNSYRAVPGARRSKGVARMAIERRVSLEMEGMAVPHTSTVP
jgi:hypothetical protein